MAYEMVMPYHLHMPSYFLETFTEYPYVFHSICYGRIYPLPMASNSTYNGFFEDKLLCGGSGN